MNDVELFGWRRRIATASVDELLGIIDEMQDPEAKVFSTRDPDQMERLARIALLRETERLLSMPEPRSGGRTMSHGSGRGGGHVRTRTIDMDAYYEADRIEDEYAQFRADLKTVRELVEQRLRHVRYRSSVRYRPAAKSPLRVYVDALTDGRS